MSVISNIMLTIITDYTRRSHLLCGEALKDQYADFRMNVLRPAEWASWHPKLVSAHPFAKGWCIKKENLKELESELCSRQITYVTIPADRPFTVVRKEPRHHVHPTYKTMITKAITELKQRNGASRHSIKRYINANFHVPANSFEKRVNLELKRMTAAEELLKIKDHYRNRTPKKNKTLPKKSQPALTSISYVKKWEEWKSFDPDRDVTYTSLPSGIQINIHCTNNGIVSTGSFAAMGNPLADETYENVAKIAWDAYHVASAESREDRDD